MMLKTVQRKLKWMIFNTLLILLFTACAPFTEPVADEQGKATGLLEVHFVDVGQADAILVKTPAGEHLLIDGGNNGDAASLIAYLEKQGVKSFDVVIGTHPHEDHIGGLDKIIERFDVQNFYMPKVVHSTKTFEDVLDAAKAKGLKIQRATSGVVLPMTSVKAMFLAPISEKYEALNNYSAVLRLAYKDHVFLFTGDAEALSEEEMLKIHSAKTLKANVLKVGHHGSVSSTSDSFLEAVSPQYAVIMSGKDNDYGHPHKETLEKLKNKGISVWRTDMDGTVIMKSDGERIEISKGAVH